jgi:WS/DGAT/MGAT family acyltransferase
MKGLRTGSVREGPERLSPLDVSNLRTEDQGLPMHVAALAFLDAEQLRDADGQLRLQDIRAHVELRTHRSRRLRQLLTRPRFGLGPPFWTDDPAFDIALHVNARPVPAPGDEASLLALCSELNEPALPRSRPLWEMWLLTGLTGNRVALLIRLHHAVADGLAAQSLLAALFDSDGEASAAEAVPGENRPRPSDWQLFTGNARDHGRALARFLTTLAHPAHLAAFIATGAQQMISLARAGRAPAVSLNEPVGPRRRLILVRRDLAATKALAHRYGAKLTDLLLAAYADGCRALLEARGELTPQLELKVSVAASLRGSGETTSGNRVGVRIVPIPVGEPNPLRRLGRIARVMSAQRLQPPYQPGGRLLQRWMVRVMFHQRLVNLLLSNLPGPPAPVYFAGAKVLEMFQIGVVQGNIPLGISVLSYSGQLNTVIVADADAIPDLEVFSRGLADAFKQLQTDSPEP